MSDLHLTLDPQQWTPTGSDTNPTSRLGYLPNLYVNGYAFHVEAYAVTETGEQCATDPTFADEVDALQRVCGARLSTQHINGRAYVVAIYPHGD